MKMHVDEKLSPTSALLLCFLALGFSILMAVAAVIGVPVCIIWGLINLLTGELDPSMAPEWEFSMSDEGDHITASKVEKILKDLGKEDDEDLRSRLRSLAGIPKVDE